MSDAETPEDRFPPRGEHTGKVQRIVEETIAPLSTKIDESERFVKRAQGWGALVVGIFMAGATAVLFLQRYATASDLEKLSAAQEQATRDFNAHVAVSAAKTAALEEQGKNIESDYHSIREQLWKVADRVGAARVPEPPHVTRLPAVP